MALIRCKECSAEIAENAEFCPKCGYKYERQKTRNWGDTLINVIPGPVVISAATAILAYWTFFCDKQTKENEKLQTMIESAVSDNAVKERTAIQIVSYLAKENKLSPKFALSVLGTVVRNGGDEKLRGEAYDAVQNLTDDAKFDQYDRLEVFCLRAALTPAQNQRQKNIRKIEEFVQPVGYSPETKEAKEARDGLKLQAASKLFSLTQNLSDPQTVIDLLLSVLACDKDPDMIEKVIPTLRRAIEIRDQSGNASNQDVIGFLDKAIEQIENNTASLKKAIEAIEQIKNNRPGANVREASLSESMVGSLSEIMEASLSEIRQASLSEIRQASLSEIRQASRSEIRLYLARALIAKNKDSQNSLIHLQEIAMSKDLDLCDDTRMLLDEIGRATQNPILLSIVKTGSSYLHCEKNPETNRIAAQRSRSGNPRFYHRAKLASH